MRRLVCTAGIVAVALAAPAGSGAVTFNGRPDLDAVAAGAKVPTPPGTVNVVTAECPTRIGENGACVDLTQAAEPTLFLPPGAYGPDERFAVLHEVGHVAWERYAPGWAKRGFLRVARIPGRAWTTAAMEKAAQAYARCALNPRKPAKVASDYLLEYAGWKPTTRQHRQSCKLIRSFL
jgi:hypothetical protein